MAALAGIHESTQSPGKQAPTRPESLVLVSAIAAFAAATALIVGAAVTFHAIVEIADAFFDMFGPDFGGSMFVAAIAGVTV